VDLGAGRARKTDPIDPSVGILVHVKVGDNVEEGETIFTILANDKKKIPPAEARLQSAVQIEKNPQEELPLFYDVIS